MKSPQDAELTVLYDPRKDHVCKLPGLLGSFRMRVGTIVQCAKCKHNWKLLWHRKSGKEHGYLYWQQLGASSVSIRMRPRIIGNTWIYGTYRIRRFRA